MSRKRRAREERTTRDQSAGQSSRWAHPLAVGGVVAIIGLVGTVTAALIAQSSKSEANASPQVTTSSKGSTREIGIQSVQLVPGPAASLLRVRGTASGLASRESVFAMASAGLAASPNGASWFVSPPTLPDRRGLWNTAIRLARRVHGYSVTAVGAELPPRPPMCGEAACPAATESQFSRRLRELSRLGPLAPGIGVQSRPVPVPDAS